MVNFLVISAFLLIIIILWFLGGPLLCEISKKDYNFWCTGCLLKKYWS